MSAIVYFGSTFRDWNRLRIAVPLFALVTLIGASIVWPLVTGLDPTKVNLALAYAPPAWMEGGRWSNLLGTDPLGRDLLTRLLAGARVSMGIAVAAITLAAIVGSIIGTVAGYFRGWTDTILSRLLDAQLSLPFVVLALPVSVALGPSLIGTVLVIAATSRRA